MPTALDELLAGLPFLVTVRLTKPQCDWLANRFRNIERHGVHDMTEDWVKDAVREVYSQYGARPRRSLQFTFCADESYYGKYGYSHLVPLREARELRRAIIHTLPIKCLSEKQRTGLEKQLRKLDDVLRTNPVERLSAIV